MQHEISGLFRRENVVWGRQIWWENVESLVELAGMDLKWWISLDGTTKGLQDNYWANSSSNWKISLDREGLKEKNCKSSLKFGWNGQIPAKSWLPRLPQPWSATITAKNMQADVIKFIYIHFPSNFCWQLTRPSTFSSSTDSTTSSHGKLLINHENPFNANVWQRNVLASFAQFQNVKLWKFFN